MMCHGGKATIYMLYLWWSTNTIQEILTSQVSKQEHEEPKPSNVDFCHRRMGHTGRMVFQEMITSEEFSMRPSDEPTASLCDTWIYLEGTKNLCKRNLMDGSFENTINTDVCGQPRIATVRGKRLFVTFTVIPHRNVRFSFIKSRKEICDPCHKFIAWVDRKNSEDVKYVHSGKAKEFLGMATTLEEVVFVHTNSTPYCPKSDRIAEQMNKSLLDKDRSMLRKIFITL